ncbi:S-layer homology domain-containing protein, partial [Paenibacillus sepulcri]|nr:S-layer homology domain-containing protein [Paenibacillus sepulcri]
YVNAAVSLKLVNGVTADKFEPKGAITRAAMATLLSRAESQFPVAFPGQETGILSSKSDTSIQLYKPQGDQTLLLSPDTNVYRYDSEKAVGLDQLLPNTNVTVITYGDQALYVEQLDDKQLVETITGTFDRAVPAENKLWIWVNDTPVAVAYDSSVTVKDAAGSVIPVASLVKDSTLSITRDTYREVPRVLSIAVQSAPINKTGSGLVKAVDAAASTISVINSASNAEEQLSVSPQAVILWQGSILQGGLAGVRAGDSLTYEVQNSIVTKITVQQTSAKSVQGEFYSASSDNKTINYIRDGGTQLEAKFVADSINVTIEGLTSTSLVDLVKGDRLELTLNEKDQVSAIKVLNRKVETINGAVIVSYEPELKALVVKNGTKLIPIYLTDSTKIDMNGTAIPLTSAATMLIKDRKVTIGYTDDKAISIQFVYKYTGTVVSINQTSRQLNLTLTGGSPFTIGFDALGVEALGKNATLADVKAGDVVTLLLNTTQDKAVTLQIHSAKQVEVVSVDVNSQKLKVKNADQTTNEWAVSGWSFYNESGELITLSGLTAGQVGNITFTGSTPSSFKKVAVASGRVSAVAADKVTIVDYNGVSTEVPLGTAYTVIKNGVSGSSAAVLQAGDRVEVRKDAAEQTLITVNGGTARSFWKFDSSAGLLSVKRTGLTDNNYTFKVTSRTKLSQGDAAIQWSDLKEGDSITLYIVQGELLEVVKKS